MGRDLLGRIGEVGSMGGEYGRQFRQFVCSFRRLVLFASLPVRSQVSKLADLSVRQFASLLAPFAGLPVRLIRI